MAMHPVIDDLDRCKMALQYIAEGQSTSLPVVLELLLEQLEDAIGQAANPAMTSVTPVCMYTDLIPYPSTRTTPTAAWS